MARTIYWLVCEKHLQDNTGKNTYICVFDQFVATVASAPGAPPLTLPLPVPCHTLPFTLAMKLSLGDGEHNMELVARDIGGEPIAPSFRMRIRTGQNGMSFVNVNFGNGVPVRDSGMVVFDVSIDGEHLPGMEVPVSVRIHGSEQ